MSIHDLSKKARPQARAGGSTDFCLSSSCQPIKTGGLSE
jgi:hypothetical protein